MSEQSSAFTQQATQSLQDGNFKQAIELIDQAITIDPNDGDAYVLKGVALAQNDQPDAATQAFRTAISASPDNVKAYYNLATHLYQLNQKPEASAMAQEALRLDPRHSAARELLTLIEQEQSSSEAPLTSQPMSSSVGMREGYGAPSEGAIRFVNNMRGTWTGIGWAISLVSLGMFVWSMSLVFPMMMEIINDPSKAEAASQAMQDKIGAAYWVMSALGWLVQISALAWGVLDLVNRRGNYLWLIGMVPCVVCSMPWFILPIYLLAGRNRIA